KQATAEEVVLSSTPNFPELLLDEQTVRSFTEYEEHRLRENLKKNINLFSVRLVLENTTFDQDLRIATDTLQKFGEIISTLPSFDANVGQDKMIFRLIVGTMEPREMLEHSLEFPGVEVLDLRKRTERPGLIELLHEEPESESEKGVDASLKSLSHTVRVDIHKLDEVINVIGELVITKAMLMNL